jgi:hypothetical protein
VISEAFPVDPPHEERRIGATFFMHMAQRKYTDGAFDPGADAAAANDLATLAARLRQLHKIEFADPLDNEHAAGIARQRENCLEAIDVLLRGTIKYSMRSEAAHRTLAAVERVVAVVRAANGSAKLTDLQELQSLAALLGEREKVRSCLLH